MNNFITVEDIKDIDFVNLAITLKSIDSKSREDMEIVCEEAGFNINNLTSNIQIHSDIVNVINEDTINSKIEGDALVTNLREVPLLVFTADCVPVAIIDRKNKAIGVAHAGWKGTYAEITKKVIETMKKEYNTNPEDIVSVIGPSIGPCCYEVSEDLVEKFNMNFTTSNEKFYTIIDGHNMLDLWKVNEHSLKDSGVKKENIINLRLCTSCQNEKFHSYRLDNKTSKRIGMVLQIK